MNLREVIARAKTLLAFFRDPANSLAKKFIAFYDFIALARPLFDGPDESGPFGAAELPSTAEDALGRMEQCCPPDGVRAVGKNGEFIKMLMAFLMKLFI